MAKENNIDVVKNKWRGYELKIKPSQEELDRYYSCYYFGEKGNYKKLYSKDEFKYKVFWCDCIVDKLLSLNRNAKTFCDIGCGEGFLINSFLKKKLDGVGYDYGYTIDNFFPGYHNKVRVGVPANLLAEEHNKYDVIALINVLEHVLYPDELILKIKCAMNESSILIITVPNDFSNLQKTLVEKGQCTNRWLCYPDHINYFNIESMKRFCNDMNLEVVSMIGNFPIECFLLNDVLNYDKDKSKGSEAYAIAKDFGLYLSTLDDKTVLKLYEDFAELGISRDITYFVKLSNNGGVDG